MKFDKGVFIGFVLSFFLLLSAAYYIGFQYLIFDNIEIVMQREPKHRQKLEQDLHNFFKASLGKPLWDVSLHKIYKEIKSLPEYANVKLKRRYPHTLVVSVDTPPPLFYFVSAKGEFYPVNFDGRLLEKVQLSDTEDKPLLRGKAFFQSDELREELISFYAHIPQKGWLSRKNISEISWSKKNGFELFMKERSYQVLFGQSGFENKVVKVERVLNYLQQHEIESRVIDSRFSKKVVVRPRNNP